MKTSYYVYLLCDPTKPQTICLKKGDLILTLEYQPFYVGRGSGRRILRHTYSNELNRLIHTDKSQRIINIRKSGFEPVPVIWRDGLTLQEAFELELFLIESFGKKSSGGPLTNKIKPHSVEREKNGKVRNLGYDFSKSVSDRLKSYYASRVGSHCDKPVYQYSISGEFIQAWRSAKHASEVLGINNRGIIDASNGKKDNKNPHYYLGYLWYKNLNVSSIDVTNGCLAL